MPKSSPALTNFNAGEFSTLLDGRIDLQKYPNAASVLENFVPTVQGPLKKRAGTWFVNQTKSNSACVLVPFEYSVSQAYVIEFGERYARFHTVDAQTGSRGTLVDGNGNCVEVQTPYRVSDLIDSDGSNKLRYSQSGDVLYVCCPGFPVYVLKRYSAVSFGYEAFGFRGGPFNDMNDSETTVYANGVEGYVQLKSSSGIFKSAHVGGLFYLEKGGDQAILQWTYDEPITATGILRQSGNNVYISENIGWCGNIKPTHTEGSEYDGGSAYETLPGSTSPVLKPPVRWRYVDSGYGIVRITRFVDDCTVEGNVEQRLSSLCVGWDNRTRRWAFGAWSNAYSYPTAVAFFKSRLWFARGQKVWSSVAEAFDDFSAKNFGEVTADMAISITLSSGQINAIQWLVPDKDLIAGTAAGEFSIGELSNGDPIGPNNIRQVLQSEYGSKSIQPVKHGSSMLFMQRAGIKAREFYYNMGSDGYTASDTTVMSEHITYGDGFATGDSGRKLFGVSQMAFAQEPDPIVWMVRTDKQLVGFTWDNEQEVKGWHRHVTQGRVESIAVIPAVEGDCDELWLCVEREGKRYIECMTYMYRDGMAPEDQFYVDCGLTYRGSDVSEVAGLNHLEGTEVAVLADGAVVHNQTVENGKITLPMKASVVHVGLPYAARYRSMRLEAGAADGVAQGKTKRINKVSFRLADAASGRYGTSFEHMDEFLFRQPSDAMGRSCALFNGDKLVDFQGDYDADGYIALAFDAPTAATVVGIFPQVTTQDR